MTVPEGPAKSDVAPAGHEPETTRGEAVTDLVRSLHRVPDHKLSRVRRLVESPSSRVFTPRSLHGLSLYHRLVSLDAVLARAEQEVMRHASTMAAFDQKVALERLMFEANAFLVEVTANMAVEHKVEDATHDPAIEEAIRRLKAEQKESPPKSPGARASKAPRARPTQTEPTDADPVEAAPTASTSATEASPSSTEP